MPSGTTGPLRALRHGPGLLLSLVALLAFGLIGMVPTATMAVPSYSLSPNTATLGPGDEQSFTLALANSTGSTASANVVVVVPDGLKYVSGSASNGGAAAAAGIVWSSVALAPSTTTNLTFKVTTSGTVSSAQSVTMLAVVSSSLGIANIPAVITLTPGGSAPSDFSASTMSVSPASIAPEQKATYKIVLRNNGAASASAKVTVQLDSRLNYIDGSAVPAGASFNGTARQLTWSDVEVPGKGEKTLSFDAELFVYINAPSLATTTARVEAAGVTVSLSSALLLTSVPVPNPPPPIEALAGSFKLVSQATLGSEEQATYTIVLNNSSTSEVKAAVTDVVPAELRYVDGSAVPAASYDSGSGTLQWSDIAVPAGSSVELKFRVGAAGSIDRPVMVINKATIVAAGRTYERRSLPLRLLTTPESTPPISKPDRPRVTAVEILGGDIHTDRDVTISISATDDLAVTKMQVREWVLDRKLGPPRWREVQRSGLIDFATSLPWQLTDVSGTHFVGVWVQDAAGNSSVLTRDALDSASLLLPGATLGRGEARPYLVSLAKGQSVSASLTTSSGDADLYVWYPGRFGLPDQRSVAEGTGADSVSFTAPEAGTYVFLVFGYEASTYSLSITTGSVAAVAVEGQATLGAKDPGLLAEPILSVAGLDPIASVSSDNGAPVTLLEKIYLPAVIR